MKDICELLMFCAFLAVAVASCGRPDMIDGLRCRVLEIPMAQCLADDRFGPQKVAPK